MAFGAENSIDKWNIFDKNVPVAKETETVIVTFEVTGVDARRLKNEASRRNISYSEMAKVLFEQGIYFWNPKQ